MARHERHTAFIIFFYYLRGSLPHGMAICRTTTSLIYGLQSTQPRSSSIYKPPTVHSRQLQARFRPVELVGRGKRTARRLRALLGDALMMVMRRTPARAAGWPAAGSSSVCTRALNFLSQLAARHVRFRIGVLQWSIVYWTVQLGLLATAFTSDELCLYSCIRNEHRAVVHGGSLVSC